MRRTARVLGVGLICLSGFIGCQRVSQRHAFPAAWPAGLDWQQTRTAAAVPAERTGPAVAVELFTLETEPAASRSAGQASTARKLTDLMVEKLRQAGVPVSESGAEYAFSGTIPKLGYTEQSGYPRKRYYTSELVYRLVHRPTGTVVWDGNLSQDFEQTVLVNTMSRMPGDPNAPERVLLEKCIAPNWETIAADVKTYLKKTPSAPTRD